VGFLGYAPLALFDGIPIRHVISRGGRTGTWSVEAARGRSRRGERLARSVRSFAAALPNG
jgi:hypothetical protein